MKRLDSLTKRDLLAARKFDAAAVRAYAEQLFSEDRYGDAFEFYRKLGDENGILNVKKAAMDLGNPELLWRIEHDNASRVTRDDWARCGVRAMELGKYRSAAYIFRRIGDAERLAAAEKEYIPVKPPAEAPPSPAGPRPA
jgi:hypothetical protein